MKKPINHRAALLLAAVAAFVFVPPALTWAIRTCWTLTVSEMSDDGAAFVYLVMVWATVSVGGFFVMERWKAKT